MAAQGHKVPELEERKSPVGYYWLLNAFMELHTCRSMTMVGPMPLPWTAITQYAEARKMSPDEQYLLEEVVGHLDDVWLNFVNAKLNRGN